MKKKSKLEKSFLNAVGFVGVFSTITLTVLVGGYPLVLFISNNFIWPYYLLGLIWLLIIMVLGFTLVNLILDWAAYVS